jgi:ATP-binding cassette subfamily G (WHITE) protein 2 (PDR)
MPGLNVEQRKRLSIAVEMVAKPELLLFLGERVQLVADRCMLNTSLDEPTSGLDSQTAWSVITLLRKLANSGQAILVTIHQPSSQLFALFDRLLLLNPEGKVAYFGEVGQDAMTVIKYFERNSAAHCDVSQNPAEWILDISSKDVTPDGGIMNWHERWVQSQERESIMHQIANLKKHRALAPDSNTPPRDRYYAASFTTQLRLVTRRMFQDYWRDRVYLYCKLTLCVVTVSSHP